MTTKYTHIGPEDQADAVAGLPNPNAYRSVDGLGIGPPISAAG